MAVPNDAPVLKVEEVAAFLRVEPSLVKAEIEARKLTAIVIGGEIRILREDLTEFLDQARFDWTAPNNVDSSTATGQRVSFKFPLRPALKPFEFRWPNGSKEMYQDAHAAVVQYGTTNLAVTVGFTKRFAAGKERERGLVLVAGRPVVEFAGADNSDRSRLMVSVIKQRKSNRHVSTADGVPPAYRHLRVEPYNRHVTGPYAYSCLAVVCRRDDLETMIEHAMIRFRALRSQ